MAISAESVAFWIDNPKTGKPIKHIKLDARLVAKLLTQSYNFEFESCGKGKVPKGVGCDNAVDNNPNSLFTDPEFQKLNPHVATVGDGFQIPTVLSGLSDMTWELTRWMAASKTAKSFVDGSFDPWGMHVNTDYLNMQLPTQSLSSMDAYLPIAHRYDPVFPLTSVAQYQVFNWYPATNWQPDAQGNFDKLTPEPQGGRALFAILDQADAAAYELPVASLQNAAGKYVLPSNAGMSAALGTMYTYGNHITQDVGEHDKKATGAYPLTMVIYAMVPTGGIAKKKARKIAQWLDFVANHGQVQGNQPGDLPTGYLPLTAKMRAQTLKAAKEVLSQKGNGKPAPSTTPAAATPKPSPSKGHISLGFVSNPLTAGLLRYALPILLIVGALLGVGGSFALAIGRGGAVAVTRLRRFRMPPMRPRAQDDAAQDDAAQSEAAREEQAVTTSMRHRSGKILLGLAVLATALIPLSPALASSAAQYISISGSGSTWSSVALSQWAQNLHADGITIQFNPDGSAAGRSDYMQQQVDFAASDPPFRNGSDPFNVGGSEHPNVGFSYVPDTAGGTAFMYHLDVGGHLITNLRLSGATLMKIFTGKITNWDNPAITHDYGQQLPNIRIIPVIRSDGSGATYFFTRWMAHVFPTEWNAFCQGVSHGKVKPPCGQTEFYPQFNGAVAQNGSNNVATYITASYGQGAIGYDEYAYALNSHYPVVALLNPDGYYVLPTASNVAVALTKAQINEDSSSKDFLQQDLDSVYTFKDPRSYPLSSYSYLVVPRSGTKIPTNFSNGAGATLSTYIDYFLCAGQQYSAELGYSPLPLNLVVGGLTQASLIPGHVPDAKLVERVRQPDAEARQARRPRRRAVPD